MNEIFLDTETTGLSPNDKHKIVEIACIETNDLISTKNIFHKIINPQRDVPDGAYNVHGFSTDFLKDKETFDQIADEFTTKIYMEELVDTRLRVESIGSILLGIRAIQNRVYNQPAIIIFEKI